MTTTSAAVTIIGHSRLAVGMLSNSLSTSSISRASGVDARLDLSAVPLLDGALATASAGLRSSLHPHNVRLRRAVAGVDRLGDDPRYLTSVRPANRRRPAGRRAGRSGRRLPRRAARGGLRAICRHRRGRATPRPRPPDPHRVTQRAGRAVRRRAAFRLAAGWMGGGSREAARRVQLKCRSRGCKLAARLEGETI